MQLAIDTIILSVSSLISNTTQVNKETVITITVSVSKVPPVDLEKGCLSILGVHMGKEREAYVSNLYLKCQIVCHHTSGVGSPVGMFL